MLKTPYPTPLLRVEYSPTLMISNLPRYQTMIVAVCISGNVAAVLLHAGVSAIRSGGMCGARLWVC